MEAKNLETEDFYIQGNEEIHKHIPLLQHSATLVGK